MSNQCEIELKWYDGEGEEVEHTFPSKNEVCDRCEGYGTHLNSSIGNHAYSMEEFHESFDEEEREEYFKRGGMYDVQCEVCHGNKVVQVVDVEHLTEGQKKLYAEYKKYDEQRVQDEQEDRHTSFMEDGGRDWD